VKEPVLIIGAGAMACLFAGSLIEAGIPVIMLDDWVAGIDALNTYGLRVISSSGQEKSFPVNAFSDISAVPTTTLALVLIKTWQTETASAWLNTCLSSKGLAVSLQNGLGNYEILVQALGPERVGVGITTLGATLLEPGRVRTHSIGEVVLGHHPRISLLMDVLSAAGFNVSTVQDIAGLLWGKLIINAAVNPLTALLNISNGQLLDLPEARDLIHRLAAETESVATALNIQIPFEPVNRIYEVLRLTANNSSSMLQDLQRGAPTEVDAINGAVTRFGEDLGVAVPYNRAVWQLVRARAAGKKYP
jgi:2-dehydropantoate 2-reductase